MKVFWAISEIISLLEDYSDTLKNIVQNDMYPDAPKSLELLMEMINSIIRQLKEE